MNEIGFCMLPGMKKSIQAEAVKMRREGWSYSVIKRKLDVSKSTLSYWLRLIPFCPNAVEVLRISKALAVSAQVRSVQKIESIQHAHIQALQDIGTMTKRDLLMFGLGLYLGEGSKAQEEVRIVNSDPDTIRIGVAWLKKACEVPDENLSLKVHAYPDTDVDAAERFWSETSGIPRAQFTRAVIDRRTEKKAQNKGKLPYGTAHVKVRALGQKTCGVLLHRRIMAWLETVKRKMRA
jgi:hypothetical protein